MEAKKLDSEESFQIAAKIVTVELQISRKGTIKVESNAALWNQVLVAVPCREFESIDQLFPSLVGLGSDPVILPPLLYFHSYRKVVEAIPNLE